MFTVRRCCGRIGLWALLKVNIFKLRGFKLAKEIKGRVPVKGERIAGCGRKKGTPNKKTKEFLEVLQKNNFDPAQALIDCYRDAQAIFDFRKKRNNLTGALVALDRRESCAESLAQFAYPKKKAIEHSGEIGVKTFADFMALGEGDDNDNDDE